MATKKRKGKGKSGSDPLSQLMGFFGRADVMGVALMLISIFTLLSLFTGSRGSLTGAWIDGLEQAFGVGVWGFPLVTAALALWLVIHAMERMEDMAWQRPLGAALLFIAFVTGANRLMEGQVTDGGGWLGMQLSQGIDDIAGGFGVWAFVAAATIIGIFLLTDQLLIELVRDGWDDPGVTTDTGAWTSGDMVGFVESSPLAPDLQRRMRAGFLALAGEFPARFRVIDGARPVAEVAAAVLQTVQAALAERADG